MGEVQLVKVRACFGDLKGLLDQIPLASTNSIVDDFTVQQLNTAVDTLTTIAKTDYSQYKIPDSKRLPDWPDKYPTEIVRAQLGRIIARLEMEYGFRNEKGNKNNDPGIVIFNKNESDVSLKINYTINELISNQEEGKSKEKLSELKAELDKPNRNWETIKGILIWILNFSKELFLQVIPIILQKNI